MHCDRSANRRCGPPHNSQQHVYAHKPAPSSLLPGDASLTFNPQLASARPLSPAAGYSGEAGRADVQQDRRGHPPACGGGGRHPAACGVADPLLAHQPCVLRAPVAHLPLGTADHHTQYSSRSLASSSHYVRHGVALDIVPRCSVDVRGGAHGTLTVGGTIGLMARSHSHA